MQTKLESTKAAILHHLAADDADTFKGLFAYIKEQAYVGHLPCAISELLNEGRIFVDGEDYLFNHDFN